MENLVSNYDIANKIEIDLNVLSSQLYSDEKIQNELYFRVYDDFEEYNNAQDDGNIPCILQVINGMVDPNQVHQLYQQTFMLRFLGYEDTEQDLKTIINQYSVNKAGLVETFTNWDAIIDINSMPLYLNKIIHNSNERIQGQLSFTYVFAIGGLLSNEVTLSLNGVEIPTLDFKVSRTKTNDTKPTPNSAESVKTDFENSSLQFELNLLYLKSNTGIIKIVTEAFDKTGLNQTYTLNYNDGIINKTYTMKLSRINIDYQSNDFAKINCVFVEG